MSDFRRFIGAVCFALLAWFVGKAMGVPVWRDGWDIGDRTDMAVAAFFAVRFLTYQEPRP